MFPPLIAVVCVMSVTAEVDNTGMLLSFLQLLANTNNTPTINNGKVKNLVLFLILVNLIVINHFFSFLFLLYSAIETCSNVSIRSATYCKSKKNPQAGIARLGSWNFLSCSGISWN